MLEKWNATSIGRFEVLRGKKDPHHLGDVVRFNDEEEVDTWDGDCNKIIGTDSTMWVVHYYTNFRIALTLSSNWQIRSIPQKGRHIVCFLSGTLSLLWCCVSSQNIIPWRSHWILYTGSW